MSRKWILLILVPVVVIGILFFLGWAILRILITDDDFSDLYDENCSVCHGENLEGTPQGAPLIGVDLIHGDSVAEISKSIAQGFPGRGMPASSHILDDAQIQSLAIFVSERRVGLTMTDFKVDAPLVIPEGKIESEQHNFRIETVARNLHPLPFSIAPLPDGRILLTEKTRGLSVISKDGEPRPYSNRINGISMPSS